MRPTRRFKTNPSSGRESAELPISGQGPAEVFANPNAKTPKQVVRTQIAVSQNRPIRLFPTEECAEKPTVMSPAGVVTGFSVHIELTRGVCSAL